MSSAQSTRISGTREWSVASINCVLGCPHRCRYCYAAAKAVQRGQCPSREAWGTTYHRLRLAEVRKRRQKVDGRVMFPTTHDITPEFLDSCTEVIDHLLSAGNDVLIVSKPHFACIRSICDRFFAFYRESILFRFSIGAVSDSILSYWEPGAPNFRERLASLKHAHDQGYATSVSCEPLLDAERVSELVETVAPYVTDTIWIGKMNDMDNRVVRGTDPQEIVRIARGQTDSAIHRISELLGNNPKVRWKESFKSVLKLPLLLQPGLDK